MPNQMMSNPYSSQNITDAAGMTVSMLVLVAHNQVAGKNVKSRKYFGVHSQATPDMDNPSEEQVHLIQHLLLSDGQSIQLALCADGRQYT